MSNFSDHTKALLGGNRDLSVGAQDSPRGHHCSTWESLGRPLGEPRLPSHSGFGPSDWPIGTDFVGENFRRLALFFGKSYRENKSCSGSENTPKKL